MKNWIILFVYTSLKITSIYSQVNINYDDARMGQLNLNQNNYFYTPPDSASIIRPSTIGHGNNNSRSSLAIFDYPDVQVLPDPFVQTEPHLIINKNHPNNLIISANYMKFIPGVPGGASNQSIFYNDNYNNPLNWSGFLKLPNTTTDLPGDPSTSVDDVGNFYVASLAPLRANYWLEKSNSPSFGVNWSNPINGIPYVANVDKGMIVTDNLPDDPASSNYSLVNRIYSVWTDFSGTPWPVQFNYSDDGGLTFQGLTNLSTRWGHGAHIQTGVYHEVYVCWSDYTTYSIPGYIYSYPPTHIGFKRSLNGGLSFSPSTSPPRIDNGGSPSTPQFGNGGIQWANDPLPPLNGTRANDFPVLAVDRSCGNYRGRIYMTYDANDPTVTNSISGFKSRIFVLYSDDQGDNWNPCNTNGIVDDNGLQNWMPWIAVDDATGNIYVAYLKANSPPPNFETCVYLAYSDDGGNTFSNTQVSDGCYIHTPLPETSFPGGYAGDYIAVDAYAGNIYVAWPQNTAAQPFWYNIYCSKLVASTPAFISAGTGIDLNLNGIVDINSPPNSPDHVLYEAYNTITAASDQEKFTVSLGGSTTFHAGKSINFLPGSNTSKDFGLKYGSLVHAYISPIEPTCTTPFRLAGKVTPSTEEISGSVNDAIIYPNPFKENFDLKYFIYHDEYVSIKLFDAFGKELISIIDFTYFEKGKYNVKINLNGKPSGLYYIYFRTTSMNFTKKIIKL